MSQQLITKDFQGDYSNVMPNTWIESIKEKASGKPLSDILNSYNMYFVPFTGDIKETRCQVPIAIRRTGLCITYLTYSKTLINEYYIGTSLNDESWGNSDNWKNLQSGKDGVSITKVNESYRYALSETGNYAPDVNSNSWKADKMSVPMGYWLWTETTIWWSDGSSTVLYSADRNPNDGVSGQKISVRNQDLDYVVTKDSGLPPDTAFQEYYPENIEQGSWLWTRTTIYYQDEDGNDAGETKSYSVSYIAIDAVGKGLENIIEYYCISDLDEGVTADNSNFETRVLTPTPELPYLWNYEEVIYSDGTGYTTDPRLIGRYSKDGKGIDSIENYYLVSTKSAGITNEDEGWQEAVPPVTQDTPYLWNKEIITFTDNTVKIIEPHVIGYYGMSQVKALCAPSVVMIPTNASGDALHNFNLSLKFYIEENDNLYDSEEIEIIGNKPDYINKQEGTYNITVINGHKVEETSLTFKVSSVINNMLRSAYCNVPIQRQYVSEGGTQGPAGVSISLSTNSIIFTQSYDSPDIIYPESYEVKVIANEGNMPVSSFVTITALDSLNYDRTKIEINEDTIIIPSSGIGIYFKNEEEKLYNTGYINFDITYAGNTVTLPVNFYVNTLGDFTTEIKGDIETSIANKVIYQINPNDKDIDKIEKIGQYIKSSEVNISRVEEHVNGLGMNNLLYNAFFNKNLTNIYSNRSDYTHISSVGTIIKSSSNGIKYGTKALRINLHQGSSSTNDYFRTGLMGGDTFGNSYITLDKAGTYVFQVVASASAFMRANGEAYIYYIVQPNLKDTINNTGNLNNLLSNIINGQSFAGGKIMLDKGIEGFKLYSDSFNVGSANTYDFAFFAVVRYNGSFYDEDVLLLDAVKLEYSETGEGTPITCKYSEIIQEVDSISSTVADTQGNYSNIRQEVDSITATVEDNEGNISKITQRVDGIETRVENNEGDYSAITETVEGITLTVADLKDELCNYKKDADARISNLRVTAEDISSTVQDLDGRYTTIRNDIDSISLKVGNSGNLLFNPFFDEVIGTITGGSLPSEALSVVSDSDALYGTKALKFGWAYLTGNYSTSYMGGFSTNSGVFVRKGTYTFKIRVKVNPAYVSGEAYVAIGIPTSSNNLATISLDMSSSSYNIYQTLVEVPKDDYIGFRLGMTNMSTGPSAFNIYVDAVILEKGDTTIGDSVFVENNLTNDLANNFIDVKDAILATGIDIYDKKIILTSDNFTVRNNSGKQTANIDESGNLSIAGVLNNMVATIDSSNYRNYGDIVGNSYFLLNPLKCPSVLRVNMTALNYIVLPVFYSSSKGSTPSVCIEPNTYQVEDLRQCIGKKLWISNIGSNPITFQSGGVIDNNAGTAPKLFMSHNNLLGDIVDITDSTTIKDEITFSNVFGTGSSPNTYTNFVFECKMGVYNGYECIYWDCQLAGVRIDK